MEKGVFYLCSTRKCNIQVLEVGVEKRRSSARSNFVAYLGLIGFGVFVLGQVLSRREPSAGRWRSRGPRTNINTAEHEQLCNQLGLEPELVTRIIENRPYATKIDLISRRIIPDDMYEAIKYNIVVREIA